MRLQLRMIEIRNEIEMLENPVFRRTYEDVHFKAKSNNNTIKYDQKANVYIVTKKDTVTRQMEYLEAARKLIGVDELVEFVPSLKVKATWQIDLEHLLQAIFISGLFKNVRIS